MQEFKQGFFLLIDKQLVFTSFLTGSMTVQFLLYLTPPMSKIGNRQFNASRSHYPPAPDAEDNSAMDSHPNKGEQQ